MNYFIIAVMSYAAIVDGRERIIPNRASIFLLLLGTIDIAGEFVESDFFLSVSFSAKLVGLVLPALGLFLLYVIAPEVSGGGDAKLISSLGFCVGVSLLFQILFLAMILGAGYGLTRKKQTIPFAPFLWAASIFFLC